MARLKTIGVTNNAGKGRYVYFQEYDNADFYDVCEEANFIAQAADIDVNVALSSPNNYHLYSYDVLTLEELKSIERLNLETGHYPDFDELGLSRIKTDYKRLRLGMKGNKPSPRWLFESKTRYANNHVKSIAHAWLFHVWEDAPFKPTAFFKETVKPARITCVYAYGPARKNEAAKRFRQLMIGLEKRIDGNLYKTRFHSVERFK